MIVMGFNCSLTIIKFGHDQEGFGSWFKNLVGTLVVSMGEFNFEDFYDAFDQSRKISRTSALIILVLMILTVTITMVNLFVAVIISDREEMTKNVVKQNLLYMAQCSQLTHNLLNNKHGCWKAVRFVVKNAGKCFGIDTKKLNQDKAMKISLHKMPGKNILKDKKVHMLPSNIAKTIGPMLEKIVETRPNENPGGMMKRPSFCLHSVDY